MLRSRDAPASGRKIRILKAGSTRQDLRPNNNQMKENWKPFVGKTREKGGRLTNGDWTVGEGKRDHLVGQIQKRYGMPATKRNAR